MNISETFDSLTYHCSNILNCDKSSLYLLDDKSRLFWTKGSRNNEIIKVSLDEGKNEEQLFDRIRGKDSRLF